MVFEESENIELKEKFTDKINKEVIAFANSDGGKLYIGIKDNGDVVGIEDVDEEMLKITNCIRDTISPDLTMFVHYDTITIDNKKIIEVDIKKGTNKPYYISSKGIRSEGVYVRQGTSSVMASINLIREMIKNTDGDSFEQNVSLNQNLSFNSAIEEFKKRDIEFRKNDMRSLKILDNDNLYTNLGLLLSDQCVHTIKYAVFQGNNQDIFLDRVEFSGSLFKQMNDAYTKISLINKTHSEIDGLYRNDLRDYPEVAIRESLLNLIVHRDYSYGKSAFINMYEDRIEFVSIGSLPKGIEIDDIKSGISICRNEFLANVFYRLKLIEAYGTGIRKIIKAYEDCLYEPLFKCTSNTFTIVLPNRNHKKEVDNVYYINDNNLVYYSDLSEEERIIDLFNTKQYITRIDVENLLDTSSSTANRIIRKMLNKNIIKQVGNAKAIKYYKAR